MKRSLNGILKRAGLASCAVAFVLAGCSSTIEKVQKFERELALPNISLEGSPNQTRIGKVDPYKKTATARVGHKVIVAAFRASGCGNAAPDFETMMRTETRDRLSVPDGIILYDAGIGTYTSKNCGKGAQARAIGAQANQKGTYKLRFFGGKATKVLTVK
jgi:hypothetical protein